MKKNTSSDMKANVIISEGPPFLVAIRDPIPLTISIL